MWSAGTFQQPAGHLQQRQNWCQERESSTTDVLYGALHMALVVTCHISQSFGHGTNEQQFVQLPGDVLSELSAVLATMITLTAESLLLQDPLMAAASDSMIINSENSNHHSKPTDSGNGIGIGNTRPNSIAPLVGNSTGGAAHNMAAGAAASSSSHNPASTERTDCPNVFRQLKRACNTLPDCNAAALQVQGLDSRALVWAAAALRGVTEYAQLASLVGAYRRIHAKSTSAQQQQHMLLVLPALLRWAASRSKTADTVQHAQQCTLIVTSAQEILCDWRSLSQLLPTPGLLAAPAAAGSFWMQAPSPAQWVQHVVTDIHKTLGNILQLCRRPGDTGSAGSAATTSVTYQTLQESLQRVFGAGTVSIKAQHERAVLSLIELLCELLQCAAARPSESSSSGVGKAGIGPVRHANNTHAGQSNAEATASGSAATSAAVHAAVPGDQLSGPSTTVVLNKPGLAGRVALGTEAQLPGMDDQTVSDLHCGSTVAALPQLPTGLAAFRGVTLRIISSFESFVRCAAHERTSDAAPEHLATHQSAAQWRLNFVAHMQTHIPFLSNMAAACATSASVTDPTYGRWSSGPLLELVHAAGPGSSEQRRMYSLLRSMLKLSSAFGHEGDMSAIAGALAALLMVPLSEPHQSSMASAGAAGSGNLQQAACCAGSVAAPLGTDSETAMQSGCAGATAASTAPVTDPSSAASMQGLAVTPLSRRQSDGATVLPAVLQVPSLVLLGHCCLHWACHLFEPCVIVPGVSQTQPRIPQAFPRALLLKPFINWLGVGVHTEQLCAAGYDVQQLLALSLLQQLQDAFAIASSKGPDKMSQVELQLIQSQLRAAGAALTCLPTHVMCNNPACSNLTGPSEMQLVTGPSSQCGACRTARYCSKACQLKHWKCHQPVCRAVAALQQKQKQLGPM